MSDCDKGYFDITIDGEKFVWCAEHLESFNERFGLMLSGVKSKEDFILWAKDNDVKFILRNWIPDHKIVDVDEYLKMIKNG